MTIKKPKLSLDEQIEHLKDKGILFNIMDESDGIRKAAEDELQKLMGRVNKHQEYYLSNSMISSTFNFLKLVVDNWFKTA